VVAAGLLSVFSLLLSTLTVSISFLLLIRILESIQSLPTRRSSDLIEQLPVNAARRALSDTLPLDRAAVRAMVGELKTSKTGTERSEEHTSELQSRFDLVCRLLLEKKKRKGSSR